MGQAVLRLEWQQAFPPHNLGEIIDATVAFINNRDITISQLMKKFQDLIFQQEE